jgi:hypothetical protein
MGRPSDYTPEIALTICDRLSDGESLRSICRDEAMPLKITVLKWLAARPEFVTQYARAREDQADTYADEITEIADDGKRDYVKDADGVAIVDHDHIARSRLRVDARKWIAAKLKPRKYGERLNTEHTGLDGGPIIIKAEPLDDAL